MVSELGVLRDELAHGMRNVLGGWIGQARFTRVDVVRWLEPSSKQDFLEVN